MLDWIIFERKVVCKSLRGLVGTREELMQLVKTQKTICELKHVLFYQYQEKGPGLERSNKVGIKIGHGKAFFPHEKFHIGSSIKKFDYYIRFLANYSKKFYRRTMKERCGVAKTKRKRDHTGGGSAGFEVVLDMGELVLEAHESAISQALSSKHEMERRFGKYIKNANQINEIIKAFIQKVKDKRRTQKEYYFTLQLKSGHFVLSRPYDFCNHLNVQQVSKELDEMGVAPPIASYRALTYIDMSLNASLLELVVRNYDLPLVSIKDPKMRFLMIMAFFKSPVGFAVSISKADWTFLGRISSRCTRCILSTRTSSTSPRRCTTRWSLRLRRWTCTFRGLRPSLRSCLYLLFASSRYSSNSPASSTSTKTTKRMKSTAIIGLRR